MLLFIAIHLSILSSLALAFVTVPVLYVAPPERIFLRAAHRANFT
jgi:hypothetical protein